MLAEGVELALQVAQGGSGRLLGQPALLGLVESLDCPARLVNGYTDLQASAEGSQRVTLAS
jgi:hypothetical protein